MESEEQFVFVALQNMWSVRGKLCDDPANARDGISQGLYADFLWW